MFCYAQSWITFLILLNSCLLIGSIFYFSIILGLGGRVGGGPKRTIISGIQEQTDLQTYPWVSSSANYELPVLYHCFSFQRFHIVQRLSSLEFKFLFQYCFWSLEWNRSDHNKICGIQTGRLFFWSYYVFVDVLFHNHISLIPLSKSSCCSIVVFFSVQLLGNVDESSEHN